MDSGHTGKFALFKLRPFINNSQSIQLQNPCNSHITVDGEFGPAWPNWFGNALGVAGNILQISRV
jgi:hypothetical protein